MVEERAGEDAEHRAALPAWGRESLHEHITPVVNWRLLLPTTYAVNARGHMEIGGCDLIDLAAEFGTPLYVYDEVTVRRQAADYLDAMGDAGQVLYSAKAFASPQFLRLVGESGMGLAAASGGEVSLGLQSGHSGDRIVFAGNNKSAEEVDFAVRHGCILSLEGVNDFDLVREVVPDGRPARALIRIAPGIVPNTHRFLETGQLDSKFGFALASGSARAAVEAAMQSSRLELLGLHWHLGSQILQLDAYSAAVEATLDWCDELRRALRFEPGWLDAGGGLGIAHTEEDDPPSIRSFVEALRDAVESGTRRRGLKTPHLLVEPGRSVAGPAGVALYTVGSIKDIPGVRRYVAVDGGMGDNIRPRLYGARYQAFLASAPTAPATSVVTVAGKYCESTDILISDIRLPHLKPGDVLCVAATGAYSLAMASNYNAIPRPAVVLVRNARARLIRRRETVADLLSTEII